MKRWQWSLVLIVAVTAGGFSAPSNAAPGAQTVRSSEGTYADGMSGYVPFPDGTTRVFGATFAIPKGTVTGTPAAGGVDLSRPWAAMTVTTYGGSGSGGLGSSASCSVATNPDKWTDLVDRAVSPRRVVGGIQFTVSCPDDPQYSAYIITFESAVFNGTQSSVYYPSKPQTAYQTWSADAPVASNGVLEANIVSSQAATMRVCALRHDSSRECHGAVEGGAQIYPSVTNLTAKGYAAR